MKLKIIIFIILLCVTVASESFGGNYAIQVSSLTDVSLSYTPNASSGNLESSFNFCLKMRASKNASRVYSLRFTGANAGDEIFRMKHDASNIYYVPYHVYYYDSANMGGNFYEMRSGINSQGFPMATAMNCPKGNRTLRIAFLKSDLEWAKSGKYSDILTIIAAAV